MISESSTAKADALLASGIFIPNAHDENAAYDGRMYETFGIEYASVVAAHMTNPNLVVTIVDGDDGNSIWLCHGLHYVNRIGYLIASKPLDDFERILLAQLSEEP